MSALSLHATIGAAGALLLQGHNMQPELRACPRPSAALVLLDLARWGQISPSMRLHRFQVTGLDTHTVPQDLIAKGLRPAGNIANLAALLPAPRLVMLYIPAGPPVDSVLQELAKHFEPGDIIADGGNSYWGD